MVMVRERFADMLDPYIRMVYEREVLKGPDYASQIFTVDTTKLAEEHVTGIGAADMPVEWQGQVNYATIDPLWKKTFRPVKYSTGIKIERELWDDAQHAEIRNMISSVMIAIHRFRQIHAHYLFNNAFTNAKTPDGEPLCSASHPYSPYNSTTQSNVGSSALSVESLEATRVAMMNFKDDKGKKILRVPDLVIVPPALEKLAREIVYSTGRPDTADRVDNVRRGAYDVLSLPLLEDSNNWFLVDSKQMKLSNLWFDRRKGVPERDEDFDTETLKWKVVLRFDYGTIDWTWIYGHNVA